MNRRMSHVHEKIIMIIHSPRSISFVDRVNIVITTSLFNTDIIYLLFRGNLMQHLSDSLTNHLLSLYDKYNKPFSSEA